MHLPEGGQEVSIFRRGESAPTHKQAITVTDWTGDGSESLVSDPETGARIVVDNQADLVAEAIQDLKDRR